MGKIFRSRLTRGALLLGALVNTGWGPGGCGNGDAVVTPIQAPTTAVQPAAYVAPAGHVAPDTAGWGSDGPTRPLSSAPVRTTAVSNIADRTFTACDATHGHCARGHVVVQVQFPNNTTQLRSFVSVVCYSGSGDFPCRSISGNTWLAFGTDGNDVEGPFVNCNGNCPAPVNTVSPWFTAPVQSQQYVAAFSFVVNTGAAGGGNFSLTGATDPINF